MLCAAQDQVKGLLRPFGTVSPSPAGPCGDTVPPGLSFRGLPKAGRGIWAGARLCSTTVEAFRLALRALLSSCPSGSGASIRPRIERGPPTRRRMRPSRDAPRWGPSLFARDRASDTPPRVARSVPARGVETRLRPRGGFGPHPRATWGASSKAICSWDPTASDHPP